MKRKLAMLCLAVTLVSGTLTGCTIGNTEIVFDMNIVGRNHVFSINGDKCSKEEARLYLCNYQNIYGNTYGLDLWEYDLGEKEDADSLEDYVKDVTLSELANIMCMEQLAKQQEISLTEAEQKKVSAAAKEYYLRVCRSMLRLATRNAGRPDWRDPKKSPGPRSFKSSSAILKPSLVLHRAFSRPKVSALRL